MSDLERPILKEDYDGLPRETYAGLGYPTHRYADIIPVADDTDQAALRDSIKSTGLVEPIVLYQGAILDGRHRYKACQLTGMAYRFVEFEGNDEAALKFVLAKNVARRNLTTAQKLTLRAKLIPEIEKLRFQASANQKAGTFVSRDTKVDVIGDSAKLLGLGRATVARVEAMERAAEEFPENEFLAEQLAAVYSGEKGVKTAYEATRSFGTDEIDRMARKEAVMTDTSKQLAQLESSIRKARDLLVDWNVAILEPDFEVLNDLTELAVWLSEAIIRVR